MINHANEHQTTALKSAVIYTRVASVASNGASAAIAQQEENCREFAAAHGYAVQRVFHDSGISGRTMQRPGFQAMLTFIAQQCSTPDKYAVIVNDISRLALSVEMLHALRTELDTAGGVLILPGMTQTPSPEHDLLVNMLAAATQYRNEMGYNDS